jgi:uncharacterized membrane protein
VEFVPIIALAALVKKVVDFLKFITNRDVNGIVTQLVAWAAGVLALLLAAQTDWADGIKIGDMSLATLNFWSLLFVGLSVSSFGSVAGYDIPRKLDRTTPTPDHKLIPG